MLIRTLCTEAKGEAMQALHESALLLLILHCKPNVALRQRERRQQVEMLLAVMQRGERWHAKAAHALQTLAPALAASVA